MSAKGMCRPMRTLRRLHNRIASNKGEPYFGEASETLSHIHIGTFSPIDSCRGVRKSLTKSSSGIWGRLYQTLVPGNEVHGGETYP